MLYRPAIAMALKPKMAAIRCTPMPIPLKVIPVFDIWAVSMEEISCAPAAKEMTKNPVLSLLVVNYIKR